MSTDGKVIVGQAGLGATAVAVKWSGAAFSAAMLGPGDALSTSLDGSVSVGTDPNTAIATLWDGAGAHTLQALLAASPDLTSDWTLLSAMAVSDDGKFVVGNGTHGTHSEGWVAHLL